MTPREIGEISDHELADAFLGEDEAMPARDAPRLAGGLGKPKTYLDQLKNVWRADGLTEAQVEQKAAEYQAEQLRQKAVRHGERANPPAHPG